MAHDMEKQTIAVIDLGTNTFHLLIVRANGPQNFQVLRREREAVLIGRGGINQGIINEDAQLRALAALVRFKEIINNYQVDTIAATATSAFRNAVNGQALAERIYQNTGITVDIISGGLEAEYIFYGVKAAMKLQGTSMIMDIGGGSVEFIICNEHHVLWKQSFEIGAQRLLDRFDIQDPITDRNVHDLLVYFEEELSALNEAVERYHPTTLIGASGTFDTLSDIYVIQNKDTIAPDASEQPLTYSFFLDILHQLSRKNREERLKIDGMVEMRVDMIVVASWLIHFVLKKYHIRQLRVSSFALKEGLLRSIINQVITN